MSPSSLPYFLAYRLEASLRELQAVLGERDALKASLDEALGRCALTLTLTLSPTRTLDAALGRCASSVVAAQLAEASQARHHHHPNPTPNPNPNYPPP